MNLFDEDFDNIVNNETIDSKVLNEQKEHEFKQWKDDILKLKKGKNDISVKTNIVHNIDDIEYVNGEVTLIFDSNIKKNVILCPISYIISCPLLVKNIKIINTDNKDIRLILYNTKSYDKDNKEIYETCNMDEVELLSIVNFVNINIIDTLFKGVFNTFDDYHKYIDILKNKFKDVNIWMHYETKILHPGIKYQSNKNFISALLRYDELVDNIIYNDTVNVSYCTFFNNCTLSK